MIPSGLNTDFITAPEMCFTLELLVGVYVPGSTVNNCLAVLQKSGGLVTLLRTSEGDNFFMKCEQMIKSESPVSWEVLTLPVYFILGL